MRLFSSNKDKFPRHKEGRREERRSRSRSPREGRRRTPPGSPGRGRKRSRSPDINRREPSLKKVRKEDKIDPHTKWQPTEQKIFQAGLAEIFDTSYGSKAMVVR